MPKNGIQLEQIRTAVLIGLPELISSLNGNPETLLRRFGYTAIDVETPDSMTSYVNFLAMLNYSAMTLNAPAFGLQLSRKQDISTLGMLGLAMQQEKNVADALKIFMRYFFVHLQASSINITVAKNIMIASLNLNVTKPMDLRQGVELGLGHGINIFRFLTGPAVKPKSAHFTHSEPKNLKLYRDIFQCPMLFESQFNGLTFDASILTMNLQSSNDQFRRVMRNHLDFLEAQYPADVVSQTRHIVKAMLSTQKCNVDFISRSLGMSKRTFQSRLKDKGITFQQLLDDVRADIARQYISNRNVNLTQLSEILGYSEASSFTRAFSRWFGMSPRQWKDSNHLGP